MTEDTVILTLGLGALAVGFIAGLVFGRHSSADTKKQEETEARLQETEAALGQYRDEVTSHFRQTAELVNRLTSDYRAVHQHLADGAQRLCVQPPEGEQKLLEPLVEREAIGDESRTESLAESAAAEPRKQDAAKAAATAEDLTEAAAIDEPERTETTAEREQTAVGDEAPEAGEDAAGEEKDARTAVAVAEQTVAPAADEPETRRVEPARSEQEEDEASDLRPPLDYVPAGLKTRDDEPAAAEQDSELKPPLDYAPRRNPNEGGVLREDYGLEKTGS